MTLYAYCNSSLRDHSLNVLKRLEQTFIERGDTRVLCRKIILSYTSQDHENLDEEYIELVDTCINLVRLGAVLHDIGKGVDSYQESGLYTVVDGECRASYPFHEVFSGIIVYRLLKRYLIRYIKVKPLLVVPVIIALYHHYTMERLTPDKIIEYIHQRFNGKITLHPELGEILLELSSKALGDLDIGLDSNAIKRRKILDPIKTNDIRVLFKYIGENYLANKRVTLLSMGLVGQVAIVDYITASIERKGRSKYLENLCREAEWLCRGIGM